jgi:chromosomal replication initiation ATPase DnaA
LVEYSISTVFRISPYEMRAGQRRRENVAFARQVAMYLAHVVGGLSLTDVGRLFQRDRTTVAHACALVEDLRDDPRFNRCLAFLEVAMMSASNRPGDVAEAVQ